MLDPMTVTAIKAEAKVTWTPELVETVRKLREAGRKTTEIAELLGTTPNAVVGIAFRRKLSRLQSGVRTRWTPEVKQHARELWEARVPGHIIAEKIGCTIPALWRAAHRYKFPRRYKVRSEYRSIPKPPTFVSISEHDLKIPAEQRVSFMKLNESTCRWPVGEVGHPEFFFCGAVPIEGRPYCAAHCSRAYGNGRT